MAKTYRTAGGNRVDLGSLILSNDNTRAVGNMGVNARGDRLNSHNEVTETRNEIVQRQYDTQHRPGQVVPQDDFIPTSSKQAEDIAKEEQKQIKRELKAQAETTEPVVEQPVKQKVAKVMPAPLPVAEEDPVPTPIKEEPAVRVEETVSIPKSDIPKGGLAAAIARAKQIKEEPEKTARQMQQEQSGVTKL